MYVSFTFISLFDIEMSTLIHKKEEDRKKVQSSSNSAAPSIQMLDSEAGQPTVHKVCGPVAKRPCLGG